MDNNGPDNGTGGSGLGGAWDRAAVDAAQKTGHTTGLPGGEKDRGQAPAGDFGLARGGADMPLHAPGDEFDLNVPHDVLDGLPPGMALDLEAPHVAPVVQELKEWASANQLPQEQVSAMVGMYAKAQAAEYRALQEASQREMQSLGANGPARIDAIARELNAKIGGTAAKSLLGMLFTKQQVEAVEGLLRLARGATTSSPVQYGGQSRGGSSDVTQIPVGTMSPVEIMSLARPSSGGSRRR